MLLEDSGALVGLMFALVGISLAEITGNPRWDALGSIGIGLLLGVIAVVLAIEMKSLLIGEAVAPQVDEEIRAAILDGPEVSRIIHLRTQHLGPDDVLLAAKLEFTCATIPELARRDRHRRGARARRRRPTVKLIFFEPDLYDAARDTTPRRTTTPQEAPMTGTAEAVDRFNEAFNRTTSTR